MKEELRVGIVGSRRRSSLRDRKIVFQIIDGLLRDNPHRELVLVSGACRAGADDFAAQAARLLGLRIVEHPVPSVDYPDRWAFAQAAYARNRKIVEDSHVVFALVHHDRKGGTENTVSHCLDLKKKVYLVDGEGRTYLSSMEERNLSDVPADPDKD